MTTTYPNIPYDTNLPLALELMTSISPKVGIAEIRRSTVDGWAVRIWPVALPTEAQILAYLQTDAVANEELSRYKTKAITELNQNAAAEEDKIDALLSGNHVRAILLNTEIVTYYEAGQPASPSANIYVIAAAMATRRGITLRAMLENLFTRWRNVQGKVAGITTELDRVTEAINVATTIAAVDAAMSSITWP